MVYTAHADAAPHRLVVACLQMPPDHPSLHGRTSLATAPADALNHRQRIALACALLPVMAVWQLNGWYLPLLAALDTRLFWAADILQWVVLPAALVWLLAAAVSLPPRRYGLRMLAHKPLALAWQAVAVWITAGLVFVVTRNLAWRQMGPGDAGALLAQLGPADWTAATLVRLYSAATAGLVESLFFIGLPWLAYAGTVRQPSPRGFAVVVSVVFSLAHWEHGSAVVAGAFFCNLVLCAWFLHWRNLWPVACGHALIDLVSLA